jgi:hypothetical protein
MPVPITEQKVVAVEGFDEKYFFEAFLTYLNLTGIQVIPMNGISSLTDKIKGIYNAHGFRRVTSFGIVRDADSNHRAAFQSVCCALRNVNLPVPSKALTAAGINPKVVVMIMPKKNTNGMLEDLCLTSVKSDPAMLCVNRFFRCLSHKGIISNEISKARMHAFLSTRHKPDLRLGEAACAHYLPFSNVCFDEVKTFLRMMQ